MKKVLFCIFIILLFISCADNILEPEQDVPKIEKEEKNELYVFDENNYSYQIKVNQKEYLKTNGYSIWNIVGNNNTEDFQNISVVVSKESGVSDMGYGLVFACKKEFDSTSMLTVLINTRGYFCIGQVCDGEFQMKKNWTYSNNLLIGYEKENHIYVVHNVKNNRFEIYFNNHLETEIQNNQTTFKDLGWGFVTTISPHENFESSYVSVRFAIK